jgi:hypothetical protein
MHWFHNGRDSIFVSVSTNRNSLVIPRVSLTIKKQYLTNNLKKVSLGTVNKVTFSTLNKSYKIHAFFFVIRAHPKLPFDLYLLLHKILLIR